jgi:hypothetical protein
MKNQGGQKAVYCSKMLRTVAIDDFLLFNFVVIFSSTYFRFSFVKPSYRQLA